MREIAGQVPENPDSLIKRILRHVLNEEVSTIQQIVGRGFNNSVTIATTGVGRFVVRTILLRAMRAAAWARDRAPSLVDDNLGKVRPLLRQFLFAG